MIDTILELCHFDGRHLVDAPNCVTYVTCHPTIVGEYCLFVR